MWDWLTDVSNFPTRDHCCVNTPWPLWFCWFSALGGLNIALSYFTNSIMLVYFWYRHRPDRMSGAEIGIFVEAMRRFGSKPIGGLFLLYAVAISVCATGHILRDVVPFFWPSYHLISTWDLLTGTLGWVVNFGLFMALRWMGRAKRQMEGA